jgi:hypothetical protein
MFFRCIIIEQISLLLAREKKQKQKKKKTNSLIVAIWKYNVYSTRTTIITIVDCNPNSIDTHANRAVQYVSLHKYKKDEHYTITNESQISERNMISQQDVHVFEINRALIESNTWQDKKRQDFFSCSFRTWYFFISQKWCFSTFQTLIGTKNKEIHLQCMRLPEQSRQVLMSMCPSTRILSSWTDDRKKTLAGLTWIIIVQLPMPVLSVKHIYDVLSSSSTVWIHSNRCSLHRKLNH